MNNDDVTTILHISDLHYDAKQGHNITPVVEALITDIRSFSITWMRPAVVVFSGDLVRGGASTNDFEFCLEHLISPVMEVCGLSSDKVVLCEGNHDLDRAAIEGSPEKVEFYDKHVEDRDFVSALYKDEDFASFVEEKFHNYYDLADVLRGESTRARTPFYSQHLFPQHSLEITTFNSSTLSTGGLKRRDEHLLAIPEPILREASKSPLPDSTLRIAVTHHPASWLVDHNKRDVEHQISSNFDVHLFGHVHDPAPKYVLTPSGRCYSAQSGALYTHRDSAYLGYSYISVSSKDFTSVRQLFRGYVDDGGRFDHGVKAAKGGVFISGGEGALWKRKDQEATLSKIQRWCVEVCARRLIPELEENVIDRPLSEIFEPPAVRERLLANEIADLEAVPNDAPKVSIDDILKSDRSAVVFGAEYSGKTSVLRWLARHALLSCADGASMKVPILVRDVDMRAGSNQLDRIARKFLPEPAAEYGFQVSSILESGKALVLVDDFTIGSESHSRWLKEATTAYPDCTFVVAVKPIPGSGIKGEVRFDLPRGERHFDLLPLTRRMVRSMASRWRGAENADGSLDRLVSRLISDLVEMNVPMTGANAALLLFVHQSRANFRPTNRVNLVRNFIEVLLEKYTPTELLRENLDFRNRTHILGFVAEKMVRADLFSVQRATLIAWINEYMEFHGWDYDVNLLVDQLTSARILAMDGGGIGFRYRAFFEYFVAVRMDDDLDFRDYVLEPSRYLEYINEIECYAGLHRNVTELLDLISDRHDTRRSELEPELTRDIDLAHFDTLSLPPPNEHWFDKVGEQIPLLRLSEAERDEVLQIDIPEDVGYNQRPIRVKYKDVGERFVASLILYSRIVRNTEFESKDKKELHLRRVLQGWSEVLLFAILGVPEIARRRKFVVSGVEYRLRAPESRSDEEIARSLMVKLPIGMSRVVREHLATEKLRQQVSSIVAAEVPSVVALMAASLYLDLGVPGGAKLAESIYERLRGHKYLLEALLHRLRDHFRLGSFPSVDENDFKRVIASAVADLVDSKKRPRDRIISDQMQRISYRRMLDRMTSPIVEFDG